MTQFEEMVSLLDKAYCCRDEIVVCLLGPVGIGKTAAVRQHAKNVKANKVVTIIASQILPSEVSGITMPDSDTKSMQIYDHYRLSSLEDGDILFFDELLEADQSVLSACLTLIESRMMMSGKLLPDIQIIAAANPTTTASSLKESIRQRFMFAKFNIDKHQVAQYIKRTMGIKVPNDVLNKLSGSSNEYNILSPRSLTKICKWICNSPDEQTAAAIDRIWNTNIGSQILTEYNYIGTDTKVRLKLGEIVPDMADTFMNCTFEEMYKIVEDMHLEDQLSELVF